MAVNGISSSNMQAVLSRADRHSPAADRARPADQQESATRVQLSAAGQTRSRHSAQTPAGANPPTNIDVANKAAQKSAVSAGIAAYKSVSSLQA